MIYFNQCNYLANAWSPDLSRCSIVRLSLSLSLSIRGRRRCAASFGRIRRSANVCANPKRGNDITPMFLLGSSTILCCTYTIITHLGLFFFFLFLSFVVIFACYFFPSMRSDISIMNDSTVLTFSHVSFKTLVIRYFPRKYF